MGLVLEIIFLMFTVEQDVGTKFALMKEKCFLIEFGYIANLFPRVETARQAGRVECRMGDSGVITLRTEVAVPNRACTNTI